MRVVSVFAAAIALAGCASRSGASSGLRLAYQHQGIRAPSFAMKPQEYRRGRR